MTLHLPSTAIPMFTWMIGLRKKTSSTDRHHILWLPMPIWDTISGQKHCTEKAGICCNGSKEETGRYDFEKLFFHLSKDLFFSLTFHDSQEIKRRTLISLERKKEAPLKFLLRNSLHTLKISWFSLLLALLETYNHNYLPSFCLMIFFRQ